MYVCISITELMVFIFIDSIYLPCFQNCLVAILFSYFLIFLYYLTLLYLGFAHGTYNVFMLQGLQPVGLR